MRSDANSAWESVMPFVANPTDSVQLFDGFEGAYITVFYTDEFCIKMMNFVF